MQQNHKHNLRFTASACCEIKQILPHFFNCLFVRILFRVYEQIEAVLILLYHKNLNLQFSYSHTMSPPPKVLRPNEIISCNLEIHSQSTATILLTAASRQANSS